MLWAVEVIEQYVKRCAPGMARQPGARTCGSPSAAGGSRHGASKSVGEWRQAAELLGSCRCTACVTVTLHLVEDGADQLCVQHQLGHWASKRYTRRRDHTNRCWGARSRFRSRRGMTEASRTLSLIAGTCDCLARDMSTRDSCAWLREVVLSVSRSTAWWTRCPSASVSRPRALCDIFECSRRS